MTRVLFKLLTMALVLGSLALASAAQAADDGAGATGGATPAQPDQQQGGTGGTGDTQDNGTGAPQGNGTNGTGGTGGTGGAGDNGTDQGQGDEQTQAQQDLDRFNRYCNMKSGEPSHSDKAFCEQFRKAHPAAAAATTGALAGIAKDDVDRFKRFCLMKDAEPSHSDKAFCDQFRKAHPAAASALSGNTDSATGTHNTQTIKPASTTQNQDNSNEPDSGPLAFTGLDIWQLVLLGLLLLGGGLGARKLLTN